MQKDPLFWILVIGSRKFGRRIESVGDFDFEASLAPNPAQEPKSGKFSKNHHFEKFGTDT